MSPRVIGWAARDQPSHIESGLVVQYGPNELPVRARRVLATSADRVEEWKKSSFEGFGISDMVVPMDPADETQNLHVEGGRSLLIC